MEAKSKIVVITLDGEEHSKRSNPKTVITMSYENSNVQKCSVYLGPKLNMKQFKQLFRKRPVEKDCVGENHKRKKQPHIQGECSNDVNSSDSDDLTSNSNNHKRFKHEHDTSNSSRFNNSKSKFNLEFIKHPRINKLSDLLSLMHHECLEDTHSNGPESCKDEETTASYQRNFLFSFCLKKFCEYCEQDHLTKKSRKSRINHFKLFKQIRSAIISYAQYSKFAKNINLRRNSARTNNKSSLKNRRGLYQPNNLYSIHNRHKTILRRCRILLGDEFNKDYSCPKAYNNMKNSNSNNSCQPVDETVCINFYHIATTNRKKFMDVVAQYRKMKKKIDKISVFDIICRFKDIFEPDVPENININYSTDDDDDDDYDDDAPSQYRSDDFILDDLDMTSNDDIRAMWTIPSNINGTSTTTTVNLEPETSIDILEKKNEEETVSTNVEKVTTAKQEQDTSSTNLSKEKETAINNSEEISIYLKINDELNTLVLTASEKAVITSIIFTDYSVNNSNWETYKVLLKPLIKKLIYYFESYKMALYLEVNLECKRGSKNKEGDLIDIEMLLKSIQLDASLLEHYFTYANDNNLLIWPMGETILNIVSPDNPAVSILINFVKSILTKVCKTVIDYLQKSGKTIVLNRESLFESLYCFPIEKHILNNEKTLLKDVNVYTDNFSTDMPEKSNTENIDLIDDTTETAFFIKKNSSNEEICKKMVDILKSDDSNHQFWEECNNSQILISKLLEAGVTFPISKEDHETGSALITTYIKWFAEEYLHNHNLNNLAISILKNILQKQSFSTKEMVEVATNYVLTIFYCQQHFSKSFEIYINKKNSKFKNENVLMELLNTNKVGMSTITNDIPIPNDFIYSICGNGEDDMNNLFENTICGNDELNLNDTTYLSDFDESLFNILPVCNDNAPLETDLVSDSSGMNLDFEPINNSEDVVLASSFDENQKDFLDIGALDLNDEQLCFDNGNKMFD